MAERIYNLQFEICVVFVCSHEEIYIWNLHACVSKRHRTTWHYKVGIKHQANIGFWTQAKSSVYCKSVVVKKYGLKASAGGKGEASVVSCREAIITPCTPL